jgi:hypothetical protein
VAGVGAGVGARGSVACCVVVGVASPSAFPGTGGSEVLLQEERIANAATKARVAEQILFIVRSFSGIGIEGSTPHKPFLVYSGDLFAECLKGA